MVETRTLGTLGIVLVGTVLAAALAVGLFWAVPYYTPVGLVAVLLVLVATVGGAAGAGRLAGRLFPGYNAAEVEVGDVITRDGSGGPLPAGPGIAADEVVDQIERADADDDAEALVVKLNTPGGAVVPSDDIRQAVADFEGPTVAYAEDMAASGGYWIACGCDEIHAREAAIVGSIGVNGTQLGRTGLAEKLGLDYRRFVAGDYKDTPAPWREISEDERDYYQGLIDASYDQFVERVAQARDIEEAYVRDTEARVYLGRAAAETPLVDAAGPREAMEDRLAERAGLDDLAVEEFEPERGLQEKLGAGAQRVAHALGAGVTGALVGDDDPPIRL